MLLKVLESMSLNLPFVISVDTKHNREINFAVSVERGLEEGISSIPIIPHAN